MFSEFNFSTGTKSLRNRIKKLKKKVFLGDLHRSKNGLGLGIFWLHLELGATSKKN
jgi:hypothetical protein